MSGVFNPAGQFNRYTIAQMAAPIYAARLAYLLAKGGAAALSIDVRHSVMDVALSEAAHLLHRALEQGSTK